MLTAQWSRDAITGLTDQFDGSMTSKNWLAIDDWTQLQCIFAWGCSDTVPSFNHWSEIDRVLCSVIGKLNDIGYILQTEINVH